MKLKTILLFENFLFFVVFAFVGCVSAKTSDNKSSPEWVGYNWKTVFSDSAYISAYGRGRSADLAKSDAVSKIAYYVEMNVEATLSTNVSTSNGTENTNTRNEVLLNSAVQNLPYVEFTKPYDDGKEWHCVAYIDRAKAWKQILSDLQEKEENFLSFLELAQKETEPFCEYICYKEVQKKAENFLETLRIGRFINNDIDRIFFESKEQARKISPLLYAKKKNMSVRIVCKEDADGIIKNSIANKFEKAGFTVSENGRYVVEAKIELNAEGNNPIAVRPLLIVTVFNADKTVYSFQYRAEEKTAAYSIETAKRRAFLKLAQEVEAQFMRNYTSMSS